jgi:hypothetical protein
MYTRKAHATREAPRRGQGWSTGRPRGTGRARWVAERFAVPLKPGNAGGGKGPQFKTNARRGAGPGVTACTLALSPYIVTRYPKASAISSPPRLLRLLPAGAIAGWDLHPLESAAFPRRTGKADDADGQVRPLRCHSYFGPMPEYQEGPVPFSDHEHSLSIFSRRLTNLHMI